MKRIRNICPAFTLSNPLQPWRRQKTFPKRWHLPTSPQGVTSQNNNTGAKISRKQKFENLITDLNCNKFILIKKKSYISIRNENQNEWEYE
jgi:hypothetical protein